MENKQRLGEDQLLISWLHNQREDLVEQAKAGSQENMFKRRVLPVLKALAFVVWANPSVFDGHSIASGDSRRHAELTSGVVSGATLFNGITNWPILFYAFRNIGATNAVFLSALLNIIILWWTNQTGTAAANRKYGNNAWSIAGVMAFLSMSIVQSVVAGVGAELINNPEGLSQLKAEQLVEAHVEKLEGIEDKLTAEDPCAIADAEFDRLRDMPGKDHRYYKTYGATYAQQQVEYYPYPQAPCSPSSKEAYSQKIESASVAAANFVDRRYSIDNDIELLKEIEASEDGAKTYSKHFREKTIDGEELHVLKSGREALTFASESFWRSITFQNVGAEGSPSLNFPLFFFALSVVTSLSAVALITMHSIKIETQMSHSTDVEDAVTYWLESVRRQYAQRPKEKKEAKVDEKLLALYIDEYRRSGKCDYHKVQTIAKMAQEGIDFRLIQDGQGLYDDIQVAYKQIETASSTLNRYLGSLKKAHDDDDEGLVKQGLADLRQGVTRLISLSKRYAAAVSLQGDKEYSIVIKTLEKQIKDKLNSIKTTPYSSLIQRQADVPNRRNLLDTVRSQLVELQGDCSELRELTQEEIRNKLIPLFCEFNATPEV